MAKIRGIFSLYSQNKGFSVGISGHFSLYFAEGLVRNPELGTFKAYIVKIYNLYLRIK